MWAFMIPWVTLWFGQTPRIRRRRTATVDDTTDSIRASCLHSFGEAFGCSLGWLFGKLIACPLFQLIVECAVALQLDEFLPSHHVVRVEGQKQGTPSGYFPVGDIWRHGVSQEPVAPRHLPSVTHRGNEEGFAAVLPAELSDDLRTRRPSRHDKFCVALGDLFSTDWHFRERRHIANAPA